MALETLFAESHLAGTCSTPANANGATTNTWTTDTGNVSWTSRWAMVNPVGTQANGTHTVTVRVRKQTGTGNPTLTISLYESGTLIQQIQSSIAITSSTGTNVAPTFNSSILAGRNLANIEVEIATVGAGGSPSVRAAVQVDTIQWSGDFTTPVVTKSGSASGAVTFGGSAAGARASRGSADGAWATLGVATSTRVSRGSTAGAFAWDGSAVGPGAEPWFTEIGGTTPELIVSSEDWSLLTNATVNNAGDWQQTFDDYFTARQAQGYNAVEVTMFSYPDPSALVSSGQDSDGVWPFAGSSNNPSNAVNEAWFARRDAFFATAETYGFRVFCNITTPYLSNGAFTASWTDTQWTDWGDKIAARWASVPNVMWIVGDDYFNEKDDQLTLLLTAMRAGGANQPMSIQNHQEKTSRTDLFDGSDLTWGQDNADYNWIYSYNVTYFGVEKAFQENATLRPIPYMWGDGYFLESTATGLTDKQLMRRMVWWALSSGAKGVQIGNNIVYPWDTTDALNQVQTNTFYTDVVPAIAGYFRSLTNWHLLEADVDSDLVTAGRGTHASSLVSGGSGGQYLDNSDSYVTASRTPDGTLAVIYMSHASTITIDEAQMVAGYTATWVDPADATTTPATPGTTYNSGTQGSNSDGQADWVLVLSQAGGNGSASGAVSWAGSATGARRNVSDWTAVESATTLSGASQGSTSGVVSWAGSSSGVRVPKGSTAGAVTWVGDADGVRTPKGSTAGAVTWVGDADGVRTPKGSTSGTHAWTGDADGVAPVVGAQQGSTTGAVTWGGSAAGTRASKGAASGAVTWVGDADGVRVPKGSTSGAHAWAGDADGTAPLVGVNNGSTSGAVTWGGSAAGTRTSEGSTSGAVTWAGFSTGSRNPEGSAAGAVTWTGDADGARTPKGSTAGAVTWGGSAAGVEPLLLQDGQAEGVHTWVGSATGQRPRAVGSSSGAMSWAGSASGAKQPVGAVAGVLSWNGAGAGARVSRGSTTGLLDWLGSSTGSQTLPYVAARFPGVTVTARRSAAVIASNTGRASAVTPYTADANVEPEEQQP